jgi:hypothetical protein
VADGDEVGKIMPQHIAKVRHNAEVWLAKVKDGTMQRWASWIVRPDEIIALCDEIGRLQAEIDRVAPYLAVHNACGYSLGEVHQEGVFNG